MDNSSKLTLHFSRGEATTTHTGLGNAPTQEQLERMVVTATNMEIVRAILDRKPIRVNSWFRSSAVNKAVGGSPTSEHTEGAAVDFVCPEFGSPLEICRALISAAHILNYNQLIYEGTWVHISFPPDGVRGKREVLTMRQGKYLKGLVP